MGDRPINLRSQLRVRTGIAALLSTLPGGIGAVEGSTMALLVAGGAEPASAVRAIGLLRVFDLWVPLLVGAVLAKAEAREPGLELGGGRVVVPVADAGAMAGSPFVPVPEPAVLVAAAA
jgi:hypothetical protein